MNWLLESPLPALTGGSLLTAMLIGGWVQTARRWTLLAATGVIAITISLVLLEKHVETEREQVTTTLKEIVQVVEQNDLEGLLEHIHPEAEAILHKARREFPNYHFGEISIRPNLEVSTAQGPPATAQATFNVVADGSISGLGLEDTSVRRYVEVDFKKNGERWQIFRYEHFEPFHGMRDQYSNRY